MRSSPEWQEVLNHAANHEWRRRHVEYRETSKLPLGVSENNHGASLGALHRRPERKGEASGLRDRLTQLTAAPPGGHRGQRNHLGD
jgi:hypothetical protein